MADYIIPNDVTTVDGDGNYSFVNPGDRLLIPHTRTTHIVFEDLEGTSENPITIINYGGKVKINSTSSTGIKLQECEHIHLTGTGHASYTYGFELYNASNNGITTNTYGGSRYLEIDHIEIHDIDGAGIRSGQANDETRETWTGYDYYFHHNYIYDVNNEGFYVGSSHWLDGVAPEIEGVEIAHNIVERCGWDGIQVGSAVADVAVHHNFVKDTGLDPELGGGNGRNGFVINHGCTGDWYNNMVINAGKRGMMFQGDGGNHNVYNNVIINAGCGEEGYGIRWFVGNNSDFYNNTIIKTTGDGLVASSGHPGNIYDNIVIESSGTNIVNEDATKYNNIESGTVEDVDFVDPDNNNLHLLSSSPARNAGSASGYAPYDYDDVSRPQESDSDIGAFEYVPTAPGDTNPIPLKNQAHRVIFPILDADGDRVSGAAGLDSEVSKDGGTFTDCTNEATEIPTSSGMYYLDLTASEMDADTVAIIVKTSTSGAKTTPIVLYPAEDTDIPVNAAAIAAAVVDAIHDEIIEGTLAYRHTRRIILASLAGKSAGGGSSTLTFRDLADSKNRISATMDENGNRTEVVLCGP